MYRHTLLASLQQWATVARSISWHDASSSACAAAERKGYARALNAALAAERAAAAAGEGAESARKAEWQRQLEQATHEVRQVRCALEAGTWRLGVRC